MSQRQDTYENLCVLLEEYAHSGVEEVAEQILGMLGLMGEDLLVALDPPPGLQTWLRSHGLSLVATAEARSPRVWETLDAEEDEEPESNPEREDRAELPLQVGDYVEYRTAPTGPHSQSRIGSGWVKAIHRDDVEVEFSPGGGSIILFPEADVIRPVTRPPAPGHTESTHSL